MSIKRIDKSLMIYFNRDFNKFKAKTNTIIDKILLMDTPSGEELTYLRRYIHELYAYLICNDFSKYSEEIRAYILSLDKIVRKIIQNGKGIEELKVIRSLMSSVYSLSVSKYTIDEMGSISEILKEVVKANKLDGTGDLEFHRGYKKVEEEQVKDK